jgi:hypothetical protein
MHSHNQCFLHISSKVLPGRPVRKVQPASLVETPLDQAEERGEHPTSRQRRLPQDSHEAQLQTQRPPDDALHAAGIPGKRGLQPRTRLQSRPAHPKGGGCTPFPERADHSSQVTVKN